MGLDEFRGIWVGLEFLPKSYHEDTQGGDVIVPGTAPDILGDVGVGQDFPGILRKKAYFYGFFSFLNRYFTLRVTKMVLSSLREKLK